MTPGLRRGRAEDILATLREDLESARELVRRGKEAFETDRLLRLSAEALLGRIGEAARLLPDDVANAVFGTDREAWVAQRVIVDHIYHRLDYDEVWSTLESDVPVVTRMLSSLG